MRNLTFLKWMKTPSAESPATRRSRRSGAQTPAESAASTPAGGTASPRPLHSATKAASADRKPDGARARTPVAASASTRADDGNLPSLSVGPDADSGKTPSSAKGSPTVGNTLRKMLQPLKNPLAMGSSQSGASPSRSRRAATQSREKKGDAGPGPEAEKGGKSPGLAENSVSGRCEAARQLELQQKRSQFSTAGPVATVERVLSPVAKKCPLASPMSATEAGAAVPGATSAKSKPSIFALDAGRRLWNIENQCGSKSAPQSLELTEAKLNHNVCIRDCKFLNLTVHPKINNVTIENCENVNVLLASVIASVEIIRSQKVNLQVTGTCSGFSIDNSQGVNLHLSLASKEAQLTTALSTEINLHVPESAEASDEIVVVPVPCQFVHKLEAANKLKTTVSDLYG